MNTTTNVTVTDDDSKVKEILGPRPALVEIVFSVEGFGHFMSSIKIVTSSQGSVMPRIVLQSFEKRAVSQSFLRYMF